MRKSWAVTAALAAAMTFASAAQAEATIVKSTPNASYQANGRVTVVVISGTTAYLGGQFTSMRPAGDPLGTGEVTRNHAAAIDLTTGGLLPWNPNVNGIIDAIYVNTVNNTVYLGGGFGKVGNHSRKKIAEVQSAYQNGLDTGPGTFISGFKTTVNNEVRSIDLANGQLYLGGTFTLPRANAASVNPTTGAFNSAWAPVTDGPIDAITATADDTLPVNNPTGKIVLGGEFNTLNGVSSNAIGAVDPTNGRSLTWNWHGPVRGSFRPFDVVGFTTDGTGSVYAAGTGNGGTFLKFDHDGNMIFEGGLNGNAVGVAVMDGELYVPGHYTTYCGAVAGFNNCPGTARDHLLAVNSTSGLLETWHPAANSALGTFTVAANAGFLATGGDFTKLGGVAQQGFGEFQE